MSVKSQFRSEFQLRQSRIACFKATGRMIMLILLSFVGYCKCNAQSGQIIGRVTDAQTGQPLPFASVYVNLTTLGTYADANGKFSLSSLPAGSYELIVSYIGHHPYQRTVNITDSLTVSLSVKLAVDNLKEVVISAKRDATWYKQLEKFKRLFIGQGPSANLCKIINTGALAFNETETQIFTAQAKEPLEIENFDLGYKITYELRNFAVSKQNYLAAGYVRFQEMETTDSLTAKRWTKNRLKAYEGSFNHFFKSLVDGALTENYYEVYEDKSELMQIVRNSRFTANLDKTIFNYPIADNVKPSTAPGVFNVKLPSRLEIHYKNSNKHSKVYWDVPYPVSWIEVKGGTLDVSKDGLVLNPLKMTVLGDMFEGRVNNILPNNYRPQVRKHIFYDSASHKIDNQLAYFTERPYLHTDKSYYYPTEIIWFKGYMNYRSLLMMDSLSQVLHVDLVDTNKSIVAEASFPINKSIIVGDLTLNESVLSGDYTLRAYTRWMLNFDTAFVFTKPIKILKPDEAVHLDKTVEPETSGNLFISSDKDEYDLREKITLTLDVRDALDNATTANLSVSVTDLTQAVPVPEETNILSHYVLPYVSYPDSLDRKTRLAIQHGFDLKGNFVTAKGKAAPGILTFVQQNVNSEFSISTKEDGTFFVPDLILFDTARVSFVARTSKRKYGMAIIDSTAVRPSVYKVKPLNLKVYKTGTMVRRSIPQSLLKPILLEAVTIKDTRIDTKSASPLSADFEVSGDWLRQRNSTDLLQSLRTKVPGLRIIVVFEEGAPKKYLQLSSGTSFSGIAEPLVIIDGQVVNDFFGGPAEQISALSANDIDRIEVIKYGNGAAYGARGGNGVIIIYTRRGEDSEKTLDLASYDKSKLIPLRIRGYATAKKFLTPDYSSSEVNKELLDNRATIYWNPVVSVTRKEPVTITFYAADLPTQYRVVVEGIAGDGQLVHNEKTLTIRKAP